MIKIPGNGKKTFRGSQAIGYGHIDSWLLTLFFIVPGYSWILSIQAT
jgi:hypothetical protein